MENYTLQSDEVILYEGEVNCSLPKGSYQITLTSQKIVLEKEKGLFKKELVLIDIIPLQTIKLYNDEVQIKQKSNIVEIQSIEKNFTLAFSGLLEARKFTEKTINAISGTTSMKRGSEKVKGFVGIVDDTLGIDTRSTIKGFLENGVKGTILNGLGKRK